ncbi:MAG: succinate dehydrogenase, hydrophobic membrane anchor protein [Lysobacterales bacterium]|nr:succinate dehydrogenase, hydrophobic membrane anchor protein [Xanthomonadales bacterium]MCB1610268.1 succinate dehydrogenase, hydrophobic membrane anchor protein [Xanthomonadales bacterium]MCP5474888.1 succinate dehydrogenase, hydrophobic membrane anchor protein [Rhodanobacteraceae bacterium]
MTAFRTPLKNVRGLGSAREGTGHWWGQRVTAIALAPLSLWFVWFAVAHSGADYSSLSTAVGQPINAVLLLAFVSSMFYHAYLGLQVVIEDYVHPRALEITLMVLIRFGAVLAVLAAAIAILRLVFLAVERS